MSVPSTASWVTSAAAPAMGVPRYPVSRIAADVGYANQGNFRKIFRNTYHMSPAEYRRSMANQSKS